MLALTGQNGDTYRAQLLRRLQDGRWHRAADLAHPRFGAVELEAWVDVLRALGHEIDQRGAASTTRYRLVETKRRR